MINEDYVLETFKEGDINIEVKVDYDNKTIWLSQNDMASLFSTTKQNISRYIKNYFSTISNMENVEQTVNDLLTVQNEGNKTTNRKIKHYNLDVILAVGYKCNPEITSIFKTWVDNTFNNNNQLNDNEKWLNEAKSYEIVKFIDGGFSLDIEVSPSEDTVWLTLDEIAILFERDRSVIGKHIKKIFDDKELKKDRCWAKNARVLSDGRKYAVDVYNLDVVLSVGYKVNSKRGTEFRIWANSILNQYLLKGYSINTNRCLQHSDIIQKLYLDIEKIINRLNTIENTIYFNNDKIFFNGQIVEAYSFIRKIFFLAKKELIIIDNYADKFLLTMLEDIKVNTTIITSTNSYLNKCEIKDNIKIINSSSLHGRYIIADEYVYLLDNSFNNIGKVNIVVTKLEDIKKEYILKDLKY